MRTTEKMEETKASEQHPEYLQVLSAVAAAVGSGQEHENDPNRIVKLSDSSLVPTQFLKTTETLIVPHVHIIEKGRNFSVLLDTTSANQQIEIHSAISGANDQLQKKEADGNNDGQLVRSGDQEIFAQFGVDVCKPENRTPLNETKVKYMSDITDLVIKELPSYETSTVTYWIGRKTEVVLSENVSVIKDVANGITYKTTLENFQVKKIDTDGCIMYLITDKAPTLSSSAEVCESEELVVHEIEIEKSPEIQENLSETHNDAGATDTEILKRNGDLNKSENVKKIKLTSGSDQSLSDLKKKSGLSPSKAKSSSCNSGHEKDEPVLDIGRSGRVRKLRPELVQYMKSAKAELLKDYQGNDADKTIQSSNDGVANKSQSPVKRKRGRPRKTVVQDEEVSNMFLEESGNEVPLFTEKKRGRGRPRKEEVEYDPEIFVVGRPRQPGRPRKIGQHLNNHDDGTMNRSESPAGPSVARRRPGRPRKSPVTIEEVHEELQQTEGGNNETVDAGVSNVADVDQTESAATKSNSKSDDGQKQNVWIDRAGNVLQAVKPYFDLAVARTKRTFCSQCLTNMHGSIKDSTNCPFLKPKHIVTNPEEGMTNVNIQSITSLPSGLCLIKNQKTNKMAVYAFEQLKPLTQYGPLVGILLTEDTLPEGVDLEDLWFLRYEEQGERHFLYCGEPENSNWCRFVQECSAEEANMLAVMRQEGIFFVTTRTISPMEPLKVHVPYYGNKERPFVHGLDIPECPKCDVKFRDMIGFQKHFHIYHPYGIKNRKLACSECGCVFQNRKVLRNHSEEMHEGKGGINCPHCERVFFYESQLSYHLKLKHPDPNVAYECPKCAKFFKSEAALRSHLQRTHSAITYPCPMCGKKFPHKSSMVKHKRHIHAKEYKHICNICERGFPDSWALKNHVASHNKNKIYICQTCHISFSSRYLVRQHLASVHGLQKVALPSDPPDSEEVEVLYEQVLEDSKEEGAGQVVEIIAEGVEEGDIIVTEGLPLNVKDGDQAVQTVELVQNGGQHILVGENQHFVIEDGSEQIKVLSADDVALQYTIETEEGEQWTV